jgi:hypothetical protein
MPFAETARAPKSSLRSEVAYGSKEVAAGIRLRRLARLALTPADILRLKQKGMLCVRSPKTAHTRRLFQERELEPG